ncbi:GntR family transcriptional regulator [Actinosynnema sp. NPDC047251]|uniref:Transcriptional regulator, GntR family n=1 Tax=Saccharothrix espanaensis (strain ATCC 51144 / DSM 44229 / JCM 9112 / NBRC 15066 / NRRL 15764) TaxID=1179773 RepID=K0JWL0_SACES|nr:GntR family transcriptional regulator [Saccharothrix espanaensis]CCH30441.1 Transcriptional regulator, GntR family [Saccharothrix espanaensis DSM 44229]
MIPPYQRIVAEITRRITAGELAPGDRVPSARQVAKEWEVALATATKALTTLRQNGLVETQPRVGTVVAADRPRPRAAAPERELTRERVVRAAIDIADAEGLAALSMRGIAARLGVAAMSPYRHVASKGDLVLMMADAVFSETSLPVHPPAHWRARVEVGVRALWELHRAHPWLAQLGPLTRPMLVPSLLAYSEWTLTGLSELGLDPTTTFDLNVLLYSHVLGLSVHLEREAQAEGATGLSTEQWMDGQARNLGRLAPAHPTFARIMSTFAETGYDLDLDALFELGLRSILDGLERRGPGTAMAVAVTSSREPGRWSGSRPSTAG